MVKRVLLAHPPGAEALARGVATELKALGYDVKKYSPREPCVGNEKVVMLWSRAAWGTPTLRAAARKAQATGSLVCVRLDNAPPPVPGATTARLAKPVAWRRLLSARAETAAPPRPARARLQTARAKLAARATDKVGTNMRLHSESTSRAFAIVLSLCLGGAAALGFAYQRYPQVAVPINNAAAAAYAQASELAALAP
jgi:hypothetical protein